MEIPFTNFRSIPDEQGVRHIKCGLCDSPVVTHRVSQGYFVGAQFHCTDYCCEQSYNAERNRLYSQIRDLENKIKELQND